MPLLLTGPFTPVRDHAPTGRPLRWRLLGWFLVFSLLPLLASNMLGYLRSRGIIERLLERDVQELAQIQARQIQDEVQRQLRELQLLTAGNDFLVAGVRTAGGRASGPMTGLVTPAELERHLTRKNEELSAFDALFLLLPDGKVLAHTGRLDREAMRVPERTPITFALLPGDSPRLRLLTPVRDEHRLTVAYLGGVIGPRGFRVMFGGPRSQGSLESFILDEQGRPIFSTSGGPLDFTQPLNTPLHGTAVPFAHYRNRAGEPVLGTAVRLPDVGWTYLAEAPLAEVLGPLQRLRSLSLAFAAGLCVLLVLTAWLVAGGIVAPVQRLVAAARRVGGGDLSARVDERHDGEVGALASAFNDMTARLEQTSARVRELHHAEIERAQQLATVGELAAGVAHEIKNPVVGIANGLDLVRRRLGTEPGLTPILEEMTRQSHRIELAVRDLLSFARPATPQLVAVDANAVVRRAVRLIQPAADRGGVQLAQTLDATLPRVRADEDLLVQALVNLLMNAVQATPSGGGVVITSSARAGSVRIAVADTGRGIAPADLEHVFKPFFTTRHSGTGLGLSITREVIERHGGRVEIDTASGVGSTFTIVLPLATTAELMPEPAETCEAV
ncbi:MAG TPA: ATP-binding protein [Longimicrobiales bacterium]|nr:ATP-binding protein [Longimicrobiales bacterium]